MRGRKKFLRIVLLISAIFFIVSVAALLFEWLMPQTLLGQTSRMLLDIHLIPDAWMGNNNFFTGRNATWVSIGWKTVVLLFFLFGGASFLRRRRYKRYKK